MEHYNRRALLRIGAQASILLVNAPPSRAAENTVTVVDLVDDPSRSDFFESDIVPFGLEEESKSEGAKTLALPPVFYLPDDAAYDRIENHDRSGSIFGIDISHYTNASAGFFKQLKFQRVRFVYAKASQGTGGRDSRFRTFWKLLGDLDPSIKVSRGAYHFLSSGSPGRQQADFFFSQLKNNGGLLKDDLPPVVDLEWDRVPGNKDKWVGRGEAYIIDNLMEFVGRIRELCGREPVCYSAKSWFSHDTIPLSSFSKLGDIKAWWWADYNNKRKLSETPSIVPGSNTVLWQFTDRALMRSGYSGGLDTSIFYGSEEQFRTAFGLA